MSEWQPIETAPKDGTKIDVWVEAIGPGAIYPTGRVPNVVWCSDAPDVGWCRRIEDGDWYGELQTIEDNRPHYRCAATHWMPLPLPPKICETIAAVSD